MVRAQGGPKTNLLGGSCALTVGCRGAGLQAATAVAYFPLNCYLRPRRCGGAACRCCSATLALQFPPLVLHCSVCPRRCEGAACRCCSAASALHFPPSFPRGCWLPLLFCLFCGDGACLLVAIAFARSVALAALLALELFVRQRGTGWAPLCVFSPASSSFLFVGFCLGRRYGRD